MSHEGRRSECEATPPTTPPAPPTHAYSLPARLLVLECAGFGQVEIADMEQLPVDEGNQLRISTHTRTHARVHTHTQFAHNSTQATPSTADFI